MINKINYPKLNFNSIQQNLPFLLKNILMININLFKHNFIKHKNLYSNVEIHSPINNFK